MMNDLCLLYSTYMQSVVVLFTKILVNVGGIWTRLLWNFASTTVRLKGAFIILSIWCDLHVSATIVNNRRCVSAQARKCFFKFNFE